MIKFGSIEQFRNTVYSVRQHTKYNANALDEDGNDIPGVQYTMPTITFTGTVKVHGSNASVRYDLASNTFNPQSRNRDLTLESDNAGFALWASTKTDFFKSVVDEIKTIIGTGFDSYVIYGEWAGPGVQAGVGVSKLDRKVFFIFSVVGVYHKVIDDVEHAIKVHIPLEKLYSIQTILDDTIFSIYEFGVWEIDIDFENPELSQNKMIDITNAVEAECPVAKAFGISGVGEGVVWTAILNSEKVLTFKVKGEKHSVSKVKTLASVDVEKVNTVKEFVASVLTEERLNQGIEYLKEFNYELTQKSTGVFLKWIATDIFKEEADTIVENNLDNKMIGSQISNQARKWYFENGIDIG